MIKSVIVAGIAAGMIIGYEIAINSQNLFGRHSMLLFNTVREGEKDYSIRLIKDNKTGICYAILNDVSITKTDKNACQ